MLKRPFTRTRHSGGAVLRADAPQSADTVQTIVFLRPLVRAIPLLVLLFVLGASTYAAPLPTTPGWFDIPNTKLRSVCPPDNFGSSGYAFTSYCNGVIDAWNGGVFDTTRNRLIIWGGGHHDYSGNEVYALDLTTLALSRLTNPTVPVASTCPESLGSQPNSRHTYDGIEYLPNVDKMFVFGGSLAT